MNQGLDTLVNHLASLFERKREKRQATIVGVERSEQSGRQGYVTAEIQRGQNSSYIQKIYVGDAASFTVGDQYWIRGSGNPVDPDWQFGEAIKSRNPTKGADVDKPVIVLTIPVATNPDDGFSNPVGVGTEQDLDANTGANAEPQAIARIYYRTIVPGTHSVYDPSTYVTHVVPQVRRVIDENWRQMPAVAVWPSAAKRLRLVDPIDDNDLAANVSDDDGVPGDDWPIGHYVYWQIDGEIVLAKVSITGVMTILTRGVEGTTAVAHLANAAILLLTGMAVLTGLDPGVNHEVRVSAQTGHNQVGPPSVSVAFVTWQRTSIPGLTGAQYLVEMRSNGFHLEWSRPTDPATLNPHTGRLSYRIYRNTDDAIDGNEKIVAEGITGFSTDIAATLWDVPATQATAYWFGIEPYDSFGNEGTILWEKDDAPAPHPFHGAVTIWPTVDSVRVHYDQSQDTGALPGDPGWGSELALYRATDTSGTGATDVKHFFAGATEYAPPLDQAYYYQVASVDFAGNVSTPINTDLYWRIAIPELLSQTGLRNGSFQVPEGGARSVSDAELTESGADYRLNSATMTFTEADRGRIVRYTGTSSGTLYYLVIDRIMSATSVKLKLPPTAPDQGTGKTVSIDTNPVYWRFGTRPFKPGAGTPDASGYTQFAFETTGGISGNRVIRLRTVGAVTAPLILWQTLAIPFNVNRTTITLKWWMKAPATVTISNSLGIVEEFSDDYGQTSLGTEFLGVLSGAAPDGNWHEYTSSLAISTILAADPTTRTVIPGIYIETTSASGTKDIYIDDVTLTYS